MQVIVYGLICGLALTLYVRMLDLSKVIYNTNWGVYLGYLAILILPACIFMALRSIKKERQTLLFRHAFPAGLLVSLLAAAIYSAYTFVDIQFFHARHLNNLFEFTASSMQKAGKTSPQIQAEIEGMKAHYYSAKPYVNTFIWYIVLGTVFTVIFFLFLRRSNPKNQII